MLVVALSSVMIGLVLAALVAILRGLQPASVGVAGETLPVAPTFGSFPSAVRLHQVLADHIGAARAIYVFGGRHVSVPPAAQVAQVRPLRASALPTIDDLSQGLPMDAKSFLEAYAAALGEPEVASGPDDFTVLVIGGTGSDGIGVTCLVQVRSTDVSVADSGAGSNFTVREVRLWDATATLPLRYAFAEPKERARHIFVGAVHTWLRYRVNPAVAEEGPVCAVFPDPWLHAGSTVGGSDSVPFSRFSYLLPVSL